MGLCFNPCAQQNSFCLGRLALIRPAVFSRSVFAGLSPHRLALSHGNGLRWPQRFHLSRSTEEANPPSGRVFLSAFAQQKPHSFPRGKPPASGPLPPRRIRLTPFPQSCHGFVLAPSSRQKPRQPRVSANLCCGESHSTREGSLVLANLRQGLRPFHKGAKCRICGNPARAPLQTTAVPCRLYLNAPPAEGTRCCGLAVPAPLRGMVFQASETEASSFSIMLCNSARQMSSEYWNSHYGFFQCLEI